MKSEVGSRLHYCRSDRPDLRADGEGDSPFGEAGSGRAEKAVAYIVSDPV